MPNYARLQGILHNLMYKDTANIYRLTHVQADDGSDDYDEGETPVYEAIPCKLSQYNKDLTQDKTDRGVNLISDLRLCCSPEYQIRENDIVEITHNGQHFRMNAGKRFVYPTHQEIPVKQVKEAGNGFDD
ncbi:hypothetical protein [Selenomonas ruminantium]|uniref:hypothetical protein n=1 Tax=Selenomonas ruminantium TaxID=971 RepID=UPI0026EB00D9|nr:hypothetical protein [Selenomonas ruminantium]